MEIFDLSERVSQALEVPACSTILESSGRERDTVLQLSVVDFLEPARVFARDLKTLESWTAFGSETPAGSLVTEQVFVASGDVRIPVFLIRRRDLEPSGNVPTLLYGYGGFDVAVTPNFNPTWRAWAEHGGLVAVACLRGGGEYGTSWHDAGRRTRNRTSSTDAFAVAAWLKGASGWTRTEHLGVTGRSNGGLLAGALLTQGPQEFAAVVPEVGVLDMLRYHLFTIGRAWISDYGDPGEAAAFETLLAYSPLHNLRAGAEYPPTLITTGDHDDRVVPGHSFKFAAALQAAQGESDPILIRIDTAAGHGVGKPVRQLVRERADVLAFFGTHLGLEA